ncbi:VAN3-binding protein-like [Lolium perenne]|uniref:VAN3-binding protein-like n=1 Tax=Lolium perenne TaxID=4522 RepID=UPI0021EA6E1E
MRTILREYFLDTFSFTGSRRRQRRDDLRLHSAQAQAALSVAQLAAAIAGVVSAFEPRTRQGDNGKLGGELASAAALVATVCAEAAESAGAHRPRVTSAVNTGLESRSPAELLTLTAAAATCLRGAAALKLRAAVVRGIGTAASGHGNGSPMAASIQKGTSLRVCLPCGRVRVRTVAVFPRRGSGGGTVALRLGQKRLRGVFATYEDHEVVALSPGGEAVIDGRRCFALALSTSAGTTVQLLLEDQTHCEVWKDVIQGMLSDAKLKGEK